MPPPPSPPPPTSDTDNNHTNNHTKPTATELNVNRRLTETLCNAHRDLHDACTNRAAAATQIAAAQRRYDVALDNFRMADHTLFQWRSHVNSLYPNSPRTASPAFLVPHADDNHERDDEHTTTTESMVLACHVRPRPTAKRYCSCPCNTNSNHNFCRGHGSINTSITTSGGVFNTGIGNHRSQEENRNSQNRNQCHCKCQEAGWQQHQEGNIRRKSTMDYKTSSNDKGDNCDQNVPNDGVGSSVSFTRRILTRIRNAFTSTLARFKLAL